MKSKYLAFILLRLFSIIYTVIYTIPYVISGVTLFTSERMMGSGNQMIPFSLILITVIVIPIIIWFSADMLSSKIIHSKDENDNYIHLEVPALLSTAIMIVGLIFAVKSLPLILSVLYSKIFYAGSVNLPVSLQGSIWANSGQELIKSLIEFIIGDILMIFNRSISIFMNNLVSNSSKNT